MGELERLGETVEFGSYLLGILALNGWTVDVRAAFAGEGLILTATHRDRRPIVRRCRSIAEVACDVFMEAAGGRDA